jgi:hypothetical protein
LNPRPLGHEPSALTTRAWLLAFITLLFMMSLMAIDLDAQSAHAYQHNAKLISKVIPFTYKYIFTYFTHILRIFYIYIYIFTQIFTDKYIKVCPIIRPVILNREQ